GGDGGAMDAEEDEEDFGFVPVQMVVEEVPEESADPGAAPAASDVGEGERAWRIEFQPKPEMYAKANEAGLVLRELARLGRIEVEIDGAEVPPLDQLMAEHAYLRWNIRLVTDKDEAAIREVFEFVEDDCILTIAEETPVAAPAAGAFEDEPPAVVPPADEFDPAALLARLTSEVGGGEAAPEAAETAPESAPEPAPAPTAEAPAPQPAAPAEPQEMGVAGLIALAQKATAEVEQAPAPAQPAAPAAAPKPAASGGSSAPAPQATIRVDLDRVDRLINAVGELVIQQAMLSQRVIESGLARSSAVALGLEDLELLTREIQDSVMAIRAQPVKSVFQRMPRLVREAADATGKKVRLVMEGENTEVDKTVIERLSDPITHMLRNAIDHGLESPAEREMEGKPPE